MSVPPVQIRGSGGPVEPSERNDVRRAEGPNRPTNLKQRSLKRQMTAKVINRNVVEGSRLQS